MQQTFQAGSGVVTPEAVRLEFEPAGVGSRALALLLDLLIQGSALITVLLALAMVDVGADLPEWAAISLSLILVFLAVWGYPITLETLWRGRTVGKAALGLRVVTVEGAPVRFRHAAVRALLTLVDFWLTGGAAAVLTALFTRRHQRLGDIAAGTMVLRERVSAQRPLPMRFSAPRGAESYAATLDPAGVGSEEYMTVRAFLLRAHELDPQARAELALQLARPLAQRIGHAPPPQVSPELFLVCLASRYQERGLPGAGVGGQAASAPSPSPWAMPPQPGSTPPQGPAPAGSMPPPQGPAPAGSMPPPQGQGQPPPAPPGSPPPPRPASGPAPDQPGDDQGFAPPA